MGYFAEIKNSKVQRIITADSLDWCVKSFGGVWAAGDEFAGVGYIYDEKHNVIYPPQPYPSWTLDLNFVWQPPVLKPDGLLCTPKFGCPVWDEGTLSWLTK